MEALTQQPTVVLIDERGCATLEIIDADGEVRSYSVGPIPPGSDAVAFRVTRLDGEGDSPYRVARAASGRWRCSCKDAIYRGRMRPCKHHVSVSRLYLFLRRLLPAAEGASP